MVWERMGSIKSHLSFFAHFFLYTCLKTYIILVRGGDLLHYEQIQISIKPGFPRSIMVADSDFLLNRHVASLSWYRN